MASKVVELKAVVLVTIRWPCPPSMRNPTPPLPPPPLFFGLFKIETLVLVAHQVVMSANRLLTPFPPCIDPVFMPSKVLKLKTVVLVTHQVAMSAPYADRIVVIDSDGTIKEQGTYEVTGVDRGWLALVMMVGVVLGVGDVVVLLVLLVLLVWLMFVWCVLDVGGVGVLVALLLLLMMSGVRLVSVVRWLWCCWCC